MLKNAGVLVLLAVTSLGCARLKPISRPTVEVESVRMVQQSEEGVRVEVRLRLENPNDVALPLVSASYRVALGGDEFAFADRTDRTLPARGSQTLLLPAALATGQRNVWRETANVSGAVRYQPPGAVRRFLTESGIPLPSVAFARQTQLQQ